MIVCWICISRLYKGIVPLWGRQIPCKPIIIYILCNRLQIKFVYRYIVWTILNSCVFYRYILSLFLIRDWLKSGLLTDTMMKFSTFENIVEGIYKYAIPTPKEQCSVPVQLGVSFSGGYMAGVLCAVVSHPADNLVSFLNNAKGATVTDVSLHLHIFFSKIFIVFRTALKGGNWNRNRIPHSLFF